MTRKESEQLYKASRQAAEPDMDKLFERIESGISEKEPTSPLKKPKLALISTLTAAAACILLMLNTPFALVGTKSDSSIMLSENSADGAASEDAADSVFITPEDGTPYEELPLAYGRDSGLRGVGSSDELFFEDSVLSETSAFIDGIIENAYLAEGDTICYELRIKEVYGAAREEIVTVESDSSIPMLIGREYLIPVKETESGLETAVENVPQIEITLDGGAVFYNGWKSLDGENAVNIEYDKRSADDFYYDRMKYTEGYLRLIEKWESGSR